MNTTATVDLVCAVFLGILYTRSFADRKLTKSCRLLNLCLAVMLATLLVDAAAYTFVGTAYALPFRFFINFLSFTASGVNILFFTFYIEALFSEETKFRPWPFHLLKTLEAMLLIGTVYEFIAGHLLTYDVQGIEDLSYVFPTYLVVLNLTIHLLLLVITLAFSNRIGRKLALLLCAFELTPILTSLLYNFAGVDLAYALGAIMLGLVAEFIQKGQTRRIKQEQTATLELANQQRIMRAFGDMVNAATWSLRIDSADEVTDVSWSDEIRHMLGYNETEFPNTLDVWTDLIHPEDRVRIAECFSSSLKGREPDDFHYDFEFRTRRKNGEYIWYHTVGRIEYNDDGTRNLFGILFDISADKKLKQQLALSDGLAREYHTVWLMDGFGEHNLHLYRSTGKATVQSAVQLGLDQPCFDTSVVRYIRDNVVEEDQERVIEETRFETIARETPETGTYAVTYRRYTDDRSDYTYHQMCFARAAGADGTINYILAYRDADRMMREQIAQQKQLQEALDEARLETGRNSVLMGIVGGATFTYDISADDEVTGAHYAQAAVSRIGEKVNSDPMAWTGLLHPEDRDPTTEAFMATVRDHTGKTPYNVTFRVMDTDGKYRWVRSGGNVIRHADGTGELFGITLDITSQMEEQQKRLLGAVPVSPDIMAKAKIGMWAFELDEGRPPRMYGDEAMLKLVGLEKQVPPEDMYHAWYDRIDDGSYDLVTDAVARMSAGEHAEVQYPWHYADGRTIIVRCGGVRNFGYTKGIRIEGTHQDVTRTLHFDEEERERAKQTEKDLIVSKLRADSLAFIEDNEPDLDSAINFFGQRILEIFGCDQVVYRETDGNRIVLNAPGSSDVPEEICAKCPFARFDCEAFSADGTVLMNDCSLGCRGVMAPADCPARSSFMQMIYSGGELVGKLTVHFLRDYHSFSEDEIGMMKIVATYLGLMIGRITGKQAEIARLAAESANKAKTQFLFSMSHDIRTPMNAILGYTDIAIRHGDEPERVQDSLKKIRSSGGHLLNLINDILEMSRIESGKMEIAEDPLDLPALLKNVDQMAGALAVKKSIDFVSSAREFSDPYVRSDELHLNEVLINLLSNAVKYTREGGKVTCSAEQLGAPRDGIARYRFTVSDTGIGMSEEFQKHLFETFSREENAGVIRQEGTGLGLSIVRHIVDLMGGTISVKSMKDQGSTFTVELPMKVMDDGEIAAFLASDEEKTVLPVEEADLKGRRVLLVEDNEMNREIAGELLTEAGLTVETAEDGELAVKAVTGKGADYYDAVLMDIQMPVMNGYEATAEIRKLPGAAKLPIIALSANAFEEDKEKSLAAGMNDHVAKPIEISSLFACLKKYL